MLDRAAFLALLLMMFGCASHDIPDEDDELPVNADIPVEAEIEGETDWIKRSPLIMPPTDVLPQDDYTLGPSDKVIVKVDDLHRPGEQAQLPLEVSETGNLSLPLVGEVKVADLTATQACKAVTDAFAQILRNPHVTLQIESYRSKKVHVYGAVRKPSTYLIPRNTVTIIEGLSLSGGLSESAGRNAVIVRKKGSGAEQIMINLEKMLTEGSGGQAFTLESGDVLYVPEAEKVFVIGYVYKPGSFLLNRKFTAMELIAQAGGPIPRAASASQTFIRRRGADGNFKIIRMDVNAVTAAQASDVTLAPGDIICVPQDGFDFASQQSWDILKGRIGANIPTVTGG